MIAQSSPYPMWEKYSQKLCKKILNPISYGEIPLEQAAQHGLRHIKVKEGSFDEGALITLSLLVDEEEGTLVDVKYLSYGPSVLIGALEAAIELLIRKNYDQASRISVHLIDQRLRDHPQKSAFPEETLFHLNLIIDAIDAACQKCQDIPLNIQTPIDQNSDFQEDYPDWALHSKEEKIALIEKIIDEEIRPYIELDAGGVTIQDLEDLSLTIAYSGACTTCYSATGSTLSAIQNILRSRIHPELSVIPDLKQPF
ncbi:MAG: NifU family protein [Simkaniaceae bacterium]